MRIANLVKFNSTINPPDGSFSKEKDKRIDDNDTPISFTNGCFERVKVKLVEFVEISAIDDIKEAINSDAPVIADFHLTSNIYCNNGVIGVSQSRDGVVTDEHTKRHAVLIVNVMDLPKRIRANEGWGLGGYSCLTEAWVEGNRLKVDFLAVIKTEI